MAEQVFPTKGNLIKSKRSLYQARLGYELMDRKRNILIREMVELSDRAKELEGTIEKVFAEAYLALQKANIMLGVNIPAAGQIPIEKRAQISYRSVMGVVIPRVVLPREPPKAHYGMSQSNSQFDAAYIKFNETKYLAATIAEIENSIYRLAVAVKKTQKRANALQNILIPKYKEQVAFIAGALEEKEREEFSRQKVIKSRKTASESRSP
ncbi:MAG: V-type ATP synthase subunit D [Oscillospiraceae bacterium]|jgi:V/A-type H+-transporting ATPase subunit D|nr:V-type ATP synthase subunit D [Oscillospiraceae bacterium]